MALTWISKLVKMKINSPYNEHHIWIEELFSKTKTKETRAQNPPKWMKKRNTAWVMCGRKAEWKKVPCSEKHRETNVNEIKKINTRCEEMEKQEQQARIKATTTTMYDSILVHFLLALSLSVFRSVFLFVLLLLETQCRVAFSLCSCTA